MKTLTFTEACDAVEALEEALLDKERWERSWESFVSLTERLLFTLEDRGRELPPVRMGYFQALFIFACYGREFVNFLEEPCYQTLLLVSHHTLKLLSDKVFEHYQAMSDNDILRIRATIFGFLEEFYDES